MMSAIVALCLSAAPARAVQLGKFDPQAFAAAQAEGRVVLVQFHAARCNVCDAQEAALTRLLRQAEFRDVLAFQADFDASPELVQSLAVGGRATLLLFRGRKEVGRGASMLTESELGAFLRTAYARGPRGRPKSRPSNRVRPRP